MIIKPTMKFFQSESQLPDFKYTTTSCLPGVLRRLSCFRCFATHHRIKETTELHSTMANPGIVAKLMGLDSIPQRISSGDRQQDHRNSNSQSQSINRTPPMVLELDKGKFFILGFEAGCKGEVDSGSRSDSRRKLLEGDGSKKKEVVKDTSNANVDFELELYDQLVLELVYIF